MPGGKFLGLHDCEVRATACAAAAQASQSAIASSIRACERARHELEAAQRELTALEEQQKRLRAQGSTFGRNWEANLGLIDDKCKAAEALVSGFLARVERRHQREQLAREQGFRAKQESRAALLALDQFRGTEVAARSRCATEDVSVGCGDIPGRYRVEFEGTEVTESLSLVRAGAALKTLRTGSVVEVLEVVTLPDEDRVRGRIMAPKGWISLLEMSSGFRWASELPQTSACSSARAPPSPRASARSPHRLVRQCEKTQAQADSVAASQPSSVVRQKSCGRLTARSMPSREVSSSLPLETKLASMGREELVDLAVLAVGGGA